MEFRDPIHGTIFVQAHEEKIITHPFFQRLRNIKQLGLSDFSFPAATHTRFLHSLGCMQVATNAIKKIFSKNFPGYETNKDFLRIENTIRLAALLHDIGHAPLSHSTEVQMPFIREMNLPFKTGEEIKATHEDFTIKAIIDSFFTPSLIDAQNKYGVQPNAIAAVIAGNYLDNLVDPQYFVLNGVNFFPLAHQLISSEMDTDRMDYLLRDSYFCGVSYGKYDLHWLMENIDLYINNNEVYLSLNQRALSAFDNFLLARYHMFLMVYFHHRSSCLENLLHLFFQTAPYEYVIPSKIEEYQKHDDHYLWHILKSSSNPYAQKMVTQDIPPKFFESFNAQDHEKIHQIHEYLNKIKIDHIYSTSQGRLSKYQGQEENFPIYVKILYPNERINAIPITMATKLFEQFQKGHSIKRIHFFQNELTTLRMEEINSIFLKFPN